MTDEPLADGITWMEDVDRHVPRLGVGDAGPEELPQLVDRGVDIDVVMVLLHRLTISADLTPVSGAGAGRAQPRRRGSGGGTAGKRIAVAVEMSLFRHVLAAGCAERLRRDGRGGPLRGARLRAGAQGESGSSSPPRTGSVVSVEPSPSAWAAKSRFCTAGNTEASMAGAKVRRVSPQTTTRTGAAAIPPMAPRSHVAEEGGGEAVPPRLPGRRLATAAPSTRRCSGGGRGHAPRRRRRVGCSLRSVRGWPP